MEINNKLKKKGEVEAPPDMTLEGGYSYLIKDDKKDVGPRSLMNKGLGGSKTLFITRAAPDKLKEDKDQQTSSFIWLTFNKGPNCIEPTNITRLSLRIQKFLQDNKQATILFDGLEYLTSQNDFSTILHFLQLLNDKIMISDSKLILSLNPSAFNPKELAQIEREMEILNEKTETILD
jgi:hypothetical protein